MQTYIQKAVQVTPVTPTPTSGPWQFDYAGRSYDQKTTFPAIDLPRDTGPYKITFTIGGQNALTFDQNDPIWVSDGGKPTGPQSNPQVQMFSISGKQLTVIDPNDNPIISPTTPPLILNYRLNFSGGDSQHQMLDPVIKNGGKTTRLPMSGAGALEVATFAISIAVLITLLFVAYQLVMLRRDLRR